MRSTEGQGPAPDYMAGLLEVHQAIQRFLASSRQPALLEPGEPQFLLVPGSFTVEFEQGRLHVQAWDRSRNLLRKITALVAERPGRLELQFERFGKRTGVLQLVDLSRPQNHAVTRRAARTTYRESFRRSLARQYPGGQIAELSSEPDLQHSLSPTYPRAMLTKGPSAWAAIGAAPDLNDVDGILSFGLIWLDYLRKPERKLHVEGLALFLPAEREQTTCLRLLHLHRHGVQFAVFTYCDEGTEARADLMDYGNLDTQLPVRHAVPETASTSDSLLSQVACLPGVEKIEMGDGRLSLRVRGLEFAQYAKGQLRFGIETKRVASCSNLNEIAALAAGIGEIRQPGDGGMANPLATRNPELWIESQVRANVQEIDASLQATPIYGQVPALAGGDRGLIDLLAVDFEGRLAVLELKASEEIHLPLQGLDYWMRVKWHLEREAFKKNGYFPGVSLDQRAPRMFLIAPSLHFHPTTATILSYFLPSITVERIGISMDWRRSLKVMFRLSGAERPT